MAFGDRTYMVVECPRCGRSRTFATWKLFRMIREKGLEPREGVQRKFRCGKCGTRGAIITGR
jgi:predicted RNA-binding Zn-ribbon protein involved in translation (DUF1610 family)